MRALALTLSLVLVSACGSVSTSYDFDPDANFASLKSYKWLAAPKDAETEPPGDAPLVLKRVHRAVDEQLAARGYKRVESGADFNIVAHLSSRERTRVTSSPTVYGYGRGYGYGGWGTQDVDVYQYDEGSIILDIVNASGGKLMWRGVARAVVPDSPKPEQITRLVDEAVTKLIANFPPKR